MSSYGISLGSGNGKRSVTESFFSIQGENGAVFEQVFVAFKIT
jgi:hypothetical protein